MLAESELLKRKAEYESILSFVLGSDKDNYLKEIKK
jgi:hypothetical protein